MELAGFPCCGSGAEGNASRMVVGNVSAMLADIAGPGDALLLTARAAGLVHIPSVARAHWASTLLVCVTAALGLLVLHAMNWMWPIPKHHWFHRKLPPGPKGHFLFGSLHEGDPLENANVERWSKQYGPVFTVWLGFVPTIVVTGAAEAREVLLKEGSLFASRPHRKSRIVLTNNHRNINTSPYGPRWRALRRNLVSSVLSPTKVAHCAPVRHGYIEDMVQKLRNHAVETPQEAVPVMDNLLIVTFKILLHFCFGKTFEEEEVIVFRETLKEILKVAGPNLGDYLPFLHLLLNPAHYRRCKDVRSKVSRIMLPIIEQHRQRRRLAGGLAHVAMEVQKDSDGDYVDTLLAAQERGEMDIADDSDIMLLCNELLNAGSDTTAITMEFAMAEMVRNPAMQTRLAQEIWDVCGDAPVSKCHLLHLHYLRAVVLETLRLHSPSSFTLPHAALRDATLGEFRVPKNAEILVCLHAISVDKEMWQDPEVFDPERFLQGWDVDVTGSRGSRFTMIPFGAGRRICPGFSVSMLQMQLTIGRLVQVFQWLPAQDGHAVDITHTTLFTVKMLNPLHARLRLRERKYPNRAQQQPAETACLPPRIVARNTA